MKENHLPKNKNIGKKLNKIVLGSAIGVLSFSQTAMAQEENQNVEPVVDSISSAQSTEELVESLLEESSNKLDLSNETEGSQNEEIEPTQNEDEISNDASSNRDHEVDEVEEVDEKISLTLNDPYKEGETYILSGQSNASSVYISYDDKNVEVQVKNGVFTYAIDAQKTTEIKVIANLEQQQKIETTSIIVEKENSDDNVTEDIKNENISNDDVVNEIDSEEFVNTENSNQINNFNSTYSQNGQISGITKENAQINVYNQAGNLIKTVYANDLGMFFVKDEALKNLELNLLATDETGLNNYPLEIIEDSAKAKTRKKRAVEEEVNKIEKKPVQMPILQTAYKDDQVLTGYTDNNATVYYSINDGEFLATTANEEGLFTINLVKPLEISDRIELYAIVKDKQVPKSKTAVNIVGNNRVNEGNAVDTYTFRTDMTVYNGGSNKDENGKYLELGLSTASRLFPRHTTHKYSKMFYRVSGELAEHITLVTNYGYSAVKPDGVGRSEINEVKKDEELSNNSEIIYSSPLLASSRTDVIKNYPNTGWILGENTDRKIGVIKFYFDDSVTEAMLKEGLHVETWAKDQHGNLLKEFSNNITIRDIALDANEEEVEEVIDENLDFSNDSKFRSRAILSYLKAPSINNTSYDSKNNLIKFSYLLSKNALLSRIEDDESAKLLISVDDRIYDKVKRISITSSSVNKTDNSEEIERILSSNSYDFKRVTLENGKKYLVIDNAYDIIGRGLGLTFGNWEEEIVLELSEPLNDIIDGSEVFLDVNAQLRDWSKHSKKIREDINKGHINDIWVDGNTRNEYKALANKWIEDKINNFVDSNFELKGQRPDDNASADDWLIYAAQNPKLDIIEKAREVANKLSPSARRRRFNDHLDALVQLNNWLGINDYGQVIKNTSVSSGFSVRDTDQDGLVDDYEVQEGLNTSFMNKDSDGDGISDRDELLQGTDPVVPPYNWFDQNDEFIELIDENTTEITGKIGNYSPTLIKEGKVYSRTVQLWKVNDGEEPQMIAETQSNEDKFGTFEIKIGEGSLKAGDKIEVRIYTESIEESFQEGQTSIQSSTLIKQKGYEKPEVSSIRVVGEAEKAPEPEFDPENIETINITKNPDNTDYVVGDNLDLTGMIIELTDTNGTTHEVTVETPNGGELLELGLNVNPSSDEALTAENTSVVVSKGVEGSPDYKSDSFNINVKEKPELSNVIAKNDGENTTVEVEGEAGSHVVVTKDGEIVGEGDITEEGTVTITLDPEKEVNIGDKLVVTPTKDEITGEAKEVVVQDAESPEAPVDVVSKNNGENPETTTVTGKGEAGTTVIITDETGEEELGRGTVDPDGNFTVDIPLQEVGTNLQVKLVDDSNNESVPTSTTVFEDKNNNGINDEDEKPEIDEVTASSDGNTTTINVKADPDTDIIIKNEDGVVVGEGKTDENGELTLEIESSEENKTNPGNRLTVEPRKDGISGDAKEIEISDNTTPETEEPVINKLDTPIAIQIPSTQRDENGAVIAKVQVKGVEENARVDIIDIEGNVIASGQVVQGNSQIELVAKDGKSFNNGERYKVIQSKEGYEDSEPAFVTIDKLGPSLDVNDTLVATVGEEVSLTVKTDGELLVDQSVNLPDWLTYDKEKGVLVGTPEEELDETTVTLRAKDEFGNITTKQFTIKVIEDSEIDQPEQPTEKEETRTPVIIINEINGDDPNIEGDQSNWRLVGVTEPNAIVKIYKSEQDIENDEPYDEVVADNEGKFELSPDPESFTDKDEILIIAQAEDKLPSEKKESVKVDRSQLEKQIELAREQLVDENRDLEGYVDLYEDVLTAESIRDEAGSTQKEIDDAANSLKAKLEKINEEIAKRDNKTQTPQASVKVVADDPYTTENESKTTVEGDTEANAVVTVTLPNGQQITGEADENGHFVIELDGDLRNGTELNIVSKVDGKNVSDSITVEVETNKDELSKIVGIVDNYVDPDNIADYVNNDDDLEIFENLLEKYDQAKDIISENGLNKDASQSEIDKVARELKEALDQLKDNLSEKLNEELQNAIDIRDFDYNYENSDYENKRQFDNAIDNAVKTIANPDSSIEDIQKARKELQEALENLNGYDNVDKTELEEEINKTNNELSENLYNYENADPERKTEFDKALEEANRVLSNDKATQEEVDEATRKLEEARENLNGYENVDKTELEEEINKTNNELSENLYNYENADPERKTEFDKALEEANKVLANEKSSQEEVDSAKERLKEARENLNGYEKVDKTELEEEINKTNNELSENLYNYENADPERKTEFDKALEEANKVLANEKSSQEEVDSAKERLKEARENLNGYEKVDKTKLDEAINKANEEIAENPYNYENSDPEKKEAFDKALEEANKVLSNDKATQEEVDEATRKLEEARENLNGGQEPSEEIVDKSGLEDAIKEAEDKKNTDDYKEADQDKKDEFDKKLEEAKEILEKEDAT
ncbi:MAG: Ig-like domain-containing protein, partial [Tissierellia bacterium]|nr:Ig-like domain-containing protein [Tissierellia bacterium]